MTEVIKAGSDAELLGLIPRLAGYTATNSIVLAAFSGKQSYAAFRVDLPQRKRTADYRAVATWIIGTLSNMRGVDGVAMVIYTDETFAANHGVPWLELSRTLGEKMHQQGFHIPGFLCVAADGWANFYDRDYPREGHPLADIPIDHTVTSLAELGALPDVTPAERSAFLELITDVCSGYWPIDLESLDTDDPREFVELCATWLQGELPDAALVLLAELSRSNAFRDEIALQFGFGMLVAGAIAEDNDRYLAIQRREGGTMDEVVRREIDAGRARLDDELAGLLMGIGRLRPDADRLERGIHQFKRIAALAPEHYRPNVLCIVAWMLWARGLGSAAGRMIDLALEIDPLHGMGQLLYTLLANGRMPEWVVE
ncbi:MAG: DUF4192 family protein [Microbacteriaceae bacterium]|nr:DUF4192 family protein [Microbacteriaceae bacterium]